MRALIQCCVLSLPFFLFACSDQSSTPYAWNLPPHMPLPPVPADNPMSVEKVALGKALFFDKRLSFNQSQACESCHHPQQAFSENRPLSVGASGQSLKRNALSLTNVAYNSTFTWAHPQLTQLERQILIPLFNEDPVELGLAGNEQLALGRLRGDDDYPLLFEQAFPNEFMPLNMDNVVKALASYVRSLISFNSRFDRYAYYGEDDALTEAELRGLAVFMSERTECRHCHGGFNFSLSTVHEGDEGTVRRFHNTGLYAQQKALNFDRGVFELTDNSADIGLFRPPTLRNIELTAPYMHDGSIETLEEVIEFYAQGGREITDGPTQGDGRKHPNKSVFMHGFFLDEQEKADLIAFLKTLTDFTFTAQH